jgi:hypothetical protein
LRFGIKMGSPASVYCLAFERWGVAPPELSAGFQDISSNWALAGWWTKWSRCDNSIYASKSSPIIMDFRQLILKVGKSASGLLNARPYQEIPGIHQKTSALAANRCNGASARDSGRS